MEKIRRRVAFAVIFLLVAILALNSQDGPSEPINGALKGESGNIQDHMFHSLYIDPLDANIVFVGTETNGIFKTVDGGQTWQRQRTGFILTKYMKGYSQIFDISSSPHQKDLIFAATINGPGPTEPAIYPSSTAGVYLSTDGGITWSQKNKGLTSTYVSYVLADPRSPGRLFAGIGGAKSSFQMNKDVFFPGGIYRSTNNGEQWVPLKTPAGFEKNIIINMMLRQGPILSIYASGQLHRDDAKEAVGLITSSDGGETWTVINPPGVTISGFDVYKGDPQIIYGHDMTEKRVCYKSLDGGKTWKQTGANFFGEIRIHPTNPEILIMTGFNSIRMSIDGMKTVKDVYVDKELASYQQMTDVEISTSQPEVIWASAKGYYLYKSTDGGIKFQKITAVRDLVYGK
jgi:photosystem II stability/assembly factor-like uncharacterized protein